MNIPIHRHKLFITILIAGILLLHFLSDRIVPSDASDWFRNAVSIFESGKTGHQFRNILFSYILAVPLFIHVDVTGFALLFSLLSIITCVVLIYTMICSKTNGCIAAFAGCLFILSFPVLRYGTQVNSDIPALAFITGTLYGVWLVLERGKIKAIPLVYLFCSIAVSLRYGSAFFAPALLYFIWVTKKDWRLHFTGIFLAFLPFIPQLIYNIHYLSHIYSISYAAHQPTLAFRYFYHESNWGIHFQFLHYVKNMYFSFRGIPVYFLPMTILGIGASFRQLTAVFARFLVIFHLSFLILLSFFAGFENRYALGALLPCFIWLALGADRLCSLMNKSVLKRTLFLSWIAVGLYISFEVGFHIIQSSKAVHQARFDIFNKATAILKSGDIVCSELYNSFYDPRIKSVSLRRKKIIYHQSYDSLQTIEPSSLKAAVYCVFPTARWLSEGQSRNNRIRTIIPNKLPSITVLDSSCSGDIIELCFYRFLRVLHKEHLIPGEKWLLVKINPLPDTTGFHGNPRSLLMTKTTPRPRLPQKPLEASR